MSLTSTLAAYVPYDNYDHTYSSGDPSTDAVLGASIIFGFFIFYIIVLAASYVITSLLLSRIFKKAGVDGWKAWVPVYNVWCLMELGGVPGFWAILMFIPIVNIAAVIFMYIAMYRIGLNLGKSGAFVLWAIFLPIVWYIWLAVDGSTWQGDKPTLPTDGKTPPSQPAAM